MNEAKSKKKGQGGKYIIIYLVFILIYPKTGQQSKGTEMRLPPLFYSLIWFA